MGRGVGWKWGVSTARFTSACCWEAPFTCFRTSSDVMPYLDKTFSSYSKIMSSLFNLPRAMWGWSIWNTEKVRSSKCNVPSPFVELSPVAASMALTWLKYVVSHFFRSCPASTRTSSLHPLTVAFFES